jgi:hypothetical protein
MSKGWMLLATLLLVACGKQVASQGAGESPNAQQSQPAEAVPAAPAHSAQLFWQGFRAAALANDPAALRSITRFPFTTRGTVDADAVVTHDLAGFEQLLPRIFEQDVGLSAEPQTVRQYIERHPELPTIATGAGQFKPVPADATRFSAGPLDFEKADNRWYWVSAYLEE